MILTLSLGHEHLFHVTVPNHIHTELAEGDRTAFESRTVMMASDSGGSVVMRPKTGSLVLTGYPPVSPPHSS